MIPDSLSGIPEILMDQYASFGVEADQSDSDRSDIPPLGQMLHLGVHGPAEVVIMSRDGDIVESHGHGVESLGGLDKVVSNGGGTMDGLQGVVEIGIWCINHGGIVTGCTFIQMPKEFFETGDGRLLCSTSPRGALNRRRRGHGFLKRVHGIGGSID